MSNSKEEFQVKSLEKIALKAVCHDITSSLRMANSWSKSWMSQSSFYSLFPQLTSQQIVDCTRKKLSENLTNTTLNNQVRKGLVEKLTKHTRSDKDCCSLDQMQTVLFSFLDSVLDESFSKLEVYVPEIVAVKDETSDLIQVIAKLP